MRISHVLFGTGALVMASDCVFCRGWLDKSVGDEKDGEI